MKLTPSGALGIAVLVSTFVSFFFSLAVLAVVNGEPKKTPKVSDYQLIYHYDTLWVKDGDRPVGLHIDTTGGFSHGNFIDSLIKKDNL